MAVLIILARYFVHKGGGSFFIFLLLVTTPKVEEEEAAKPSQASHNDGSQSHFPLSSLWRCIIQYMQYRIYCLSECVQYQWDSFCGDVNATVVSHNVLCGSSSSSSCSITTESWVMNKGRRVMTYSTRFHSCSTDISYILTCMRWLAPCQCVRFSPFHI